MRHYPTRRGGKKREIIILFEVGNHGFSGSNTPHIGGSIGVHIDKCFRFKRPLLFVKNEIDNYIGERCTWKLNSCLQSLADEPSYTFSQCFTISKQYLKPWSRDGLG